MVSQLKVNEIIKQSGSSISIGESGDTITLPSTATLSNFPNNKPLVSVYASADTSMSDNSFVKVPFNTETFDSDGTYDHSSNYRWTPAVAGKYFVSAHL